MNRWLIFIRHSTFDVGLIQLRAPGPNPSTPARYRLETASPQHVCNFIGRTLVADHKLPGSEMGFAILKFRRDNSAANGAVQMLAALPRVTSGFGVATRAHHGHAQRNKGIAQ